MLTTEENEVLHPAQSQEAQDLIEQAQCLARLRDAPTRMLEGLLVVDVMLAGKARCQCFVLPGRELFDRLEDPARHKRWLTMLHSEVQVALGRRQDQTPLMLFMLFGEDLHSDARAQSFASLIRTDGNFALKEVGTLADLENVLTPVFPVSSTRAALTEPLKTPALTTGPAEQLMWTKPAPAPDVTLVSFVLRASNTAQDLSIPEKDLLQSTFTRVQGSSRLLQLDMPEAQLGWEGASADSPDGLPLRYCSGAERALFGLLLALVKTYRTIQPGQVLCISEALNNFDIVTQTRVLDVLIDFQAATGVHLYLRTNRTEARGWARRKFRAIYGDISGIRDLDPGQY